MSSIDQAFIRVFKKESVAPADIQTEPIADTPATRRTMKIDESHSIPRPHVEFANKSPSEKQAPRTDEPAVPTPWAAPQLTSEPEPSPSPVETTGGHEDLWSSEVAMAGSVDISSLLAQPEQIVDVPAAPMTEHGVAEHPVAETHVEDRGESASKIRIDGLHMDSTADLMPHMDAGSVEQEQQVADDSEQEILPLWEVDSLTWPAPCEQLELAAKTDFDQAGAKLRHAAQDGLKILGIASALPGEGVTTLAMTIARAAQRYGVQVGLVDANFGNAQLCNELGFEAPCSWHDFVTGRLPQGEVCIFSDEDNMHVFPLLGEVASQELADMSADAISQKVREMADSVELMIVDLGPLHDDFVHPLLDGEEGCVDAVILVRDLRKTTLAQGHEVVQRLFKSGIAAVGFAENFAP